MAYVSHGRGTTIPNEPCLGTCRGNSKLGQGPSSIFISFRPRSGTWKCTTICQTRATGVVASSFFFGFRGCGRAAKPDTDIPDPMKILPDKLLVPHLSSWKPDSLDGIDSDLVHYCRSDQTCLLMYSTCLEMKLRLNYLIVASTASSSLVAFDQDTAGFRDLLIKMALSTGTVSSTAVLFALLAVSSQHRDGLQSRALHFKTSAISALAKSVNRGALGTTEATQHVAAGMLLCSFEVCRI